MSRHAGGGMLTSRANPAPLALKLAMSHSFTTKSPTRRLRICTSATTKRQRLFEVPKKVRREVWPLPKDGSPAGSHIWDPKRARIALGAPVPHLVGHTFLIATCRQAVFCFQLASPRTLNRQGVGLCEPSKGLLANISHCCHGSRAAFNSSCKGRPHTASPSAA